MILEIALPTMSKSPRELALPLVQTVKMDPELKAFTHGAIIWSTSSSLMQILHSRSSYSPSSASYSPSSVSCSPSSAFELSLNNVGRQP
jgi:hypothetical protein